MHPAAGDGGAAVGAALCGYHALLEKPRAFVMEHAAWDETSGRAAMPRWRSSDSESPSTRLQRFRNEYSNTSFEYSW